MAYNRNNTNPKHPRIIFLAEDDLDDQEFLKEALLSLDPDIILASFANGLKFMNHLSQTNEDELPSLIILDYNIPEINGAEILQQLSSQEKFADIPKLVWSTSDSKLFRESCLRYGAKAYLVKPSSIGGIQELAKQMLTYC